MAKMKVLSSARKRAFDSVPKLTKEATIGYFTLDIETKRILNKMQSDVAKVGYLVSKAYFQAKGRFFESSRFLEADIKRATKALGRKQAIDFTLYTPDKASRHKKQILAQHNWQALTSDTLSILALHANSLVDIRMNKEDILFTLVSSCWIRRIEIPSYNQLVDIISTAFQAYEVRMLGRVNESLPSKKKKALLSFFNLHSHLYSVRELKRIDQGLGQRSLNQNAQILQLFGEQFYALLPTYKKIELTDAAIHHFADAIYLGNNDEIRRLKNDNKQSLFYLSFIYDQFYKRQDFAADAIIKVVKQFTNRASGNERAKRDEQRVTTLEANKTILNSAKDAKRVLELVLSITKDKALSFEERNERAHQLITAFFSAENPDFDKHLERVGNSIVKQTTHADYYRALFENSIKLQRMLGALVTSMSFDKKSKNQPLIDALNYYLSKPKTIDDDAPRAFLSKAELLHLDAEDDINPLNKYRAFLFMSIAKGLKDKSLTLLHSYRYLQTPSYMISTKEWANHRQRLLAAASLEKFADGYAVLKRIGESVTHRFNNVSARIKKDDNHHFTVKEDGSWRIRYPDPEFSIAKFIPTILGASRSVTIQDVMFEIERHTEFSNCFRNRLPRSGNTEVDIRLLFATILSLGTNLGHTELARASKLFSEKALKDTENSWVSIANLQRANDCLVKTIQSLALPTIYNESDGRLHSSSDGKKVVVNVNSLLANYSYKYYGKEQGISVNSFLDEKQSFFHVNVLTSSDREAPYVLEGLVSSKATITEDEIIEHYHSTDTHGYTEAVFAGLHLMDVSFAPRIKNVHEQTLYAYGSQSTSKHFDSPIAPKTQINKKLILDNWDDILRLMASMKLKRCSASQMLKMLSSSERDNTVYRAFKEFGRLLKTHFILNYIDDEELRQKIQKQLNRVELGQKLADKVLFGRNGKLQVGLHDEIQLVMASNTLIRNMIILWNYLFLSDYCLSLDTFEERDSVVKSISTGSVISWAHINFMGIYEFNPVASSQFKSTLKQMRNVVL
ncbi:Tn3 family transposase [Brumicola blandensis]|uniref:Tn3 family transposase n=1 Tax=Brumicola blandensis TaxID=3075611 RepID=A0AAW8QZE0_9ALTE|nr:Tn3 family transposase [Alteromonas sp. W409]MDT0581504.1 Tn3 family transposase [Alteromonas sp. W409]